MPTIKSKFGNKIKLPYTNNVMENMSDVSNIKSIDSPTDIAINETPMTNALDRRGYMGFDDDFNTFDLVKENITGHDLSIDLDTDTDLALDLGDEDLTTGY